MDLQTITIKEYLTRKGIEFLERNGELIVHCIFNKCGDDDRANERHLYFSEETGQYLCHKCSEKSNIFTLSKNFI